MFFKKKKPKLDSKVRFQHKQFMSKLDSARNFKRANRAVPESGWQKLLQKLGLSGLWSQIAAGLLLLGLLYLIYIPNLLSVKQFEFTGISENQAEQLEAEIRKAMDEVSVFNPQYNLVFFDAELVNQAAAKVPTVDYIASVKKDFKDQIVYIEAASKYERFLVAGPEAVLDVYNDGSIKGPANVSLSDWPALLNSNMVKVLMHQKFGYSQYQSLFAPQLLAYLNSFLVALSALEGQQLAHLTFKEPAKATESVVTEVPSSEENPGELPEIVAEPEPVVEPLPPAEPEIPEIQLPFDASEVHAVFYKNNDLRRTYRVIFDATGDAAQDLTELELLLSQTPADRYNQLYYIDLRIPDKAYLCLESAPCAN